MTLQEKTYDSFVDHATKVNRYAQSQKKVILSEVSFLLKEIKEELLKGEKVVSLADVREMVRQADKLFKDGYAIIQKNIFNDAYELLEVELEGQSSILQELLDEYNIFYTVKLPNINRTQKRLEELPLNNMPIIDWLDLWQKKTRNIMKSELIASYSQFKDVQDADSETPLFKDRYDIIDNVFGEVKNPLNHSTFLRTGSDIGALVISLTDSVMAETASSIGNSNHSIIIGEVWNSCLCATTCSLCASLHGAVKYYSGEDETDGNEIPLHPNCQCHWTYLFRDAKAMGAKIPSEDRNNINSGEKLKTGRVWYNSISKERQVDLFGVTRVKMLDAGTIKFNELLTQKNRRLYTLDELKTQGYRVPKRTN